MNSITEKHYSSLEVAKQFRIHNSQVECWLQDYKQYGFMGLIPKLNQSFTTTFKLTIIRAIERGNLSLSAAR